MCVTIGRPNENILLTSAPSHLDERPVCEFAGNIWLPSLPPAFFPLTRTRGASSKPELHNWRIRFSALLVNKPKVTFAHSCEVHLPPLHSSRNTVDGAQYPFYSGQL